MKKELKIRQKIFLLLWAFLTTVYNDRVHNVEEIFLLHVFLFLTGFVLYYVIHNKKDECLESERNAKFSSIASIFIVSTYLVIIACSIIHYWNYIIFAIVAIVLGYLFNFVGED